jgi:hypothetical protein
VWVVSKGVRRSVGIKEIDPQGDWHEEGAHMRPFFMPRGCPDLAEGNEFLTGFG